MHYAIPRKSASVLRMQMIVCYGYNTRRAGLICSPAVRSVLCGPCAAAVPIGNATEWPGTGALSVHPANLQSFKDGDVWSLIWTDVAVG